MGVTGCSCQGFGEALAAGKEHRLGPNRDAGRSKEFTERGGGGRWDSIWYFVR